jgi:NTE family protein
VFKPVEIDGVKYIDGAFTNSVPADAVRKLGADYVIGIDLSTHEQKNSVVNKVFPSYKSDTKEPWAKGYKYSDIMIKPNLSGYTAYSVSSGADMYDLGYNSAMEVMSKIISEIKAISRNKK